jgi:hypothetical protein
MPVSLHGFFREALARIAPAQVNSRCTPRVASGVASLSGAMLLLQTVSWSSTELPSWPRKIAEWSIMRKERGVDPHHEAP